MKKVGLVSVIEKVSLVTVLFSVAGVVLLLVDDIASYKNRPVVCFAEDGSIAWVTVVNDDGVEVKYTEAAFEAEFDFEKAGPFRYEYLPENWRSESTKATSEERAPWDVEPVDPPQE